MVLQTIQFSWLEENEETHTKNLKTLVCIPKSGWIKENFLVWFFFWDFLWVMAKRKKQSKFFFFFDLINWLCMCSFTHQGYQMSLAMSIKGIFSSPLFFLCEDKISFTDSFGSKSENGISINSFGVFYKVTGEWFCFNNFNPNSYLKGFFFVFLFCDTFITRKPKSMDAVLL